MRSRGAVVAERLVSIAAGVTPELFDDPVGFVEAAVNAGWPATGIWYEDASWSDQTVRELRHRLADSGIVALDMEVVRMGTRHDCGEALIDAAVQVGARNILTVSSFDDPGQTADRFAELCQRAEPAGIRVCIEFMRFTSIKDTR